MVSSASIAAMAVSLIVSLALPAAFLWYFLARFKVSLKVVGVGALMFVVSALVLERLMHAYFLQWNSATAQFLQNPWAFAAYGSIAAGVFEESGRYVAFKFFLKRFRGWQDGIAYGIGHGGIEAILIGVLANVSNIATSVLIDTGAYGAIIAKTPAAQAATMQMIQRMLSSTPSEFFLVGGFERAMAFLLQVALSVLVLYGVKQGRVYVLLLAIVLHAIVDFPAALAQKGVLGLWGPEAAALAAGILGAVFIARSKRLFENGAPAAAG